MQPKPTDAVKGGENPIEFQAVLGTASKVGHPDHVQFCRDMAAHGVATRIADMRLLWRGPVAHAKDVFDIMSKTKVPCIWDELGKGVVVYPAVYSEVRLYRLLVEWDSLKIGVGVYLHQGHPLRTIALSALNQVQSLIQ